MSSFAHGDSWFFLNVLVHILLLFNAYHNFMLISIAFNMPMNIALYGDSYVSRLKNFCKSDLRVPANVCWYDRSGLRSDFLNRKGRIDETAKNNYDDLKELKPDVVFINVGGNDLSTKSDPREVYERIMALVHEMRQVGVNVVYVAEIMTRGDFSKCPDTEMNKTSFDRQRRKINTLLAKELKERFVKFGDVHYPSDYSRDLVHLSDFSDITNNTGLKKYESRLRRIFCSLKS